MENICWGEKVVDTKKVACRAGKKIDVKMQRMQGGRGSLEFVMNLRHSERKRSEQYEEK